MSCIQSSASVPEDARMLNVLHGNTSLPTYITISCQVPVPHLSGTVCRSQFGDRQHCQFSVTDSKPSFLLDLSVRDVSTALTLLRDTSYCYVSLQFLGLYDTIVIRPSSSSSTLAAVTYARLRVVNGDLAVPITRTV